MLRPKISEQFEKSTETQPPACCFLDRRFMVDPKEKAVAL
jgi:hypothetical protein